MTEEESGGFAALRRWLADVEELDVENWPIFDPLHPQEEDEEGEED